MPYVFIGGAFVGGCDRTKALIASGEFDALVGGEGADADAGDGKPPSSSSPTTAKGGVDLESQPLMRVAGVDEAAPRVVGALFEFPNTVDNRIIRLVATQARVLAGACACGGGGVLRTRMRVLGLVLAVPPHRPPPPRPPPRAPTPPVAPPHTRTHARVQVFVLSVLIAALAYKKDESWRWVSVGLLVDFVLRFYVSCFARCGCGCALHAGGGCCLARRAARPRAPTHPPAPPQPPPLLLLQAGAGISPLGSAAMLTAALMDLILPKLGVKTGPKWGAGAPPALPPHTPRRLPPPTRPCPRWMEWAAGPLAGTCATFNHSLRTSRRPSSPAPRAPPHSRTPPSSSSSRASRASD